MNMTNFFHFSMKLEKIMWVDERCWLLSVSRTQHYHRKKCILNLNVETKIGFSQIALDEILQSIMKIQFVFIDNPKIYIISRGDYESRISCVK